MVEAGLVLAMALILAGIAAWRAEATGWREAGPGMGALAGAAAAGMICSAILAAQAKRLGGRQARQRQLESALAELAAENRMRRLLSDQSSDAVTITDLDGIILDVNEAQCRAQGKPRAALVGQSVGVLGGEASDRPGQRPIVARTLAEGRWHGELVNVTAAGGKRVVDCRTWLLRDERGEPFAMGGFGTDVTDKRRAEEASRLTAEMFRDVFQLSPDAISLLRLHDGVYLEINPGFSRITGYAREEILGRTGRAAGVAIWADEADMNRLVACLKERGEVSDFEARFRVKGGTFMHGLLSAKIVSIGGEQCVLAVAQDITERVRAHAALRESERRFRAVADEAPVMIWMSGPNRGLTFVNQRMLDFTGRPAERELGKGWMDGMQPDDYARCEEAYARHFEARTAFTLEYWLRRADGEFRVVSENGAPRHDGGGVFLGFIGTATDVTENRRNEAKLARSESRLRRAEQVAGFGNWELRLDTGEMSASESARLIYGYEGASFPLSDVRTRPLAEYRPMLDEAMRALVEEGRPYDVEFKVRRPADGRLIDIHSIAEHDRASRTVFGIIQDITAQKMAEAGLKESAYFLRKAQEAAGLGSFKFSFARGSWTGSPQFDEIFGLDGPRPQGIEAWLELVVPEQRQEVRDAITAELASGRRKFVRDFCIVRRDNGQRRWVTGFGELDCDAQGQPRLLIGMIQDVTARREAEQALRTSEAKLRSIFRATPVGIGVLKDGLVTEANDVLCAMMGCAHGELVGRRARALFPTLATFDPGGGGSHGAPNGDGPSATEVVGRRIDGGLFDVRLSFTALDPENLAAGVTFSATDVTERNRAHDRLRLQSGALEAAANAIIIANRAGQIEWANPAFTATTGYSLKESVGKKVGAVLKSGRHDVAFYRAMWDTITAGRVWHGEIVNRRKDGSLYTEDMTITPIRSDAGEITHFIAVKQDISQRKALESQFLQAQKMEAVGHLAGGVAHDFNNILAAVMMYLGLLQEEPALERSTLVSLSELEKEVQRGAILTRQLLAFSRQQAMEPALMDLGEVTAGLMKMLRRLLGEHIIMSLDRQEGALLMQGDAGMIEQVVINLCINARDAMPRGGPLTLRTESVEVSAEAAAARAEAREGRYRRVVVTDGGCGMDEATMARIFEPFFTTKAVGKGTGLGLATVYGVVKQHHGWVEVESAPGRGTTFRVDLPACDEPSLAVVTEAPSVQPNEGRGETILVTEDEPSLRNVIELSLRRHGYEVITAEYGTEALEQWARHGAAIDLLITDMVMPGGIDGMELAGKLRETKPALKVILCTGYSQVFATEAPDAAARVTLLRKPFNIPHLLAVVRHTLDAVQATGV
jgi:PAS domain S-box-containing protein